MKGLGDPRVLLLMITYKDSLVHHSNCHLEVQPSLAQSSAHREVGGRAENGQEHD